METDTYLTIKNPTEGLYKEKGSRFIALAYPVSSEGEVKDIVQQLKRQYHDARHHCYAYILGFKGDVWRANDDGEPSSTAGKPIHGQLVSRGLTNVLVVVVRYFGGTKLGVSGLINAYKTAASDALEKAEVITRSINDVYQINFSYGVLNDVMRLIKDEELAVKEQQFDTQCMVMLGIRQSKVALVLEKFSKIESVMAEYMNTE
ncbi:MAG TPA: YigZ family protein [Tenuifilaceae bacterium]|jgi:uncharacterized YigZ family protein|nr:YigZ family protein [Tenuifilaceae bacterium]